MGVNRRSFLKLAVTASGSLMARPARAHGERGLASPDGFGILVDTTYCIGCRRCEWGCNQVNDLPKHGRQAFDDTAVPSPSQYRS